MNNRFKDLKLTGDPDKDFAALLIAHHEDLVFLAKTQLEYGGDRQLRQLAQRLEDETGKQISELKEWQVRSRQADYKAQPDQPPHGSGPLDRQAQAAPTSPSAPPASPPAPAGASAQPAANLPLVAGKVESVDTAQGKLTIEHGPIPNLNMDGMTMVFRAADPAMVRTIKKGDRIQFSADRVNGQITVTRIQKSR
ncbi:copper-binding protein [Enterovirga aerilata]|nr:copper-binding protein [Enterovirga sp. DB1703]